MTSVSINASEESGMGNLVLSKRSTDRSKSSPFKCMRLAMKIMIVIAVIFLFLMTVLAMTSMFIPNAGSKSIMIGLIIGSGVVTIFSLFLFIVLQSVVNNKKMKT